MSIGIAANGMAYDASTGLFAYQPRRRTWWYHGNKIELSVIAWPNTIRVLHRIEQCRQMIAAHKATAERIRKSEVRRFDGYAYDNGGRVRLRYMLTKPMRPDERRDIQTYYNALSHVAAAYRYLGVRL